MLFALARSPFSHQHRASTFPSSDAADPADTFRLVSQSFKSQAHCSFPNVYCTRVFQDSPEAGQGCQPLPAFNPSCSSNTNGKFSQPRLTGSDAPPLLVHSECSRMSPFHHPSEWVLSNHARLGAAKKPVGSLILDRVLASGTASVHPAVVPQRPPVCTQQKRNS